MKLSRWKCGICGFEWLERSLDLTTPASIDHGCPQGCDDAARIVANVGAADWRPSK